MARKTGQIIRCGSPAPGWFAFTSAVIRRPGNEGTSPNPYMAVCGTRRPISTVCSRSATWDETSALPGRPSASTWSTGSTSQPDRDCGRRAIPITGTMAYLKAPEGFQTTW